MGSAHVSPQSRSENSSGPLTGFRLVIIQLPMDAVSGQAGGTAGFTCLLAGRESPLSSQMTPNRQSCFPGLN